jgi:hypothetical protein
MTLTCDVCKTATLTVTVTSTLDLDERQIPRAVYLIAQQQGWRCEVRVVKGVDVTLDACPGCRR